MIKHYINYYIEVFNLYINIFIKKKHNIILKKENFNFNLITKIELCLNAFVYSVISIALLCIINQKLISIIIINKGFLSIFISLSILYSINFLILFFILINKKINTNNYYISRHLINEQTRVVTQMLNSGYYFNHKINTYQDLYNNINNLNKFNKENYKIEVLNLYLIEKKEIISIKDRLEMHNYLKSYF